MTTISYAVTACVDDVFELHELLDVLIAKKRECDTIHVLYDGLLLQTTLEKYVNHVQFKEYRFNGNFAEHKNVLNQMCSGTYIFQIDADEIPSDDLIESLPEILELNNTVDLFYIPRANTLYAEPDGITSDWYSKNFGFQLTPVKHYVNWPDFQGRVYRNSPEIKWEGHVHERISGVKSYAALIDNPDEECPYVLYHNKTFWRQFEQNCNYNRLMILDKLKQTGNWYPHEPVTTSTGVYYAKWKHPYQGSWETTSLYTPDELSNIEKMIHFTPEVTGVQRVVIDIGAQAGYMTAAYALFCDYVVAFEPNPAAFEVLDRTTKLIREPEYSQDYVAHNYAISDAYAVKTFHYSDPGLCNGGDTSKVEAGVGVTGHSLPIPVFCIPGSVLDEWFPVDAYQVGFIKIDTEGSDAMILNQLKNLIDKHKPVIQCEIYDGLSLNERQHLLNVIHELGYTSHDMAVSSDIDALGPDVTDASTLKLNSGHNLLCLPLENNNANV